MFNCQLKTKRCKFTPYVPMMSWLQAPRCGEANAPNTLQFIQCFGRLILLQRTKKGVLWVGRLGSASPPKKKVISCQLHYGASAFFNTLLAYCRYLSMYVLSKCPLPPKKISQDKNQIKSAWVSWSFAPHRLSSQGPSWRPSTRPICPDETEKRPNKLQPTGAMVVCKQMTLSTSLHFRRCYIVLVVLCVYIYIK